MRRDVAMLVERFFVPAEEAADAGLKEIDMRRMGRFVALAGKNGAGKTRLLERLQFFVEARANGLPDLPLRQERIDSYKSSLSSSPEHQHAKYWRKSLSEDLQQLVHIRDRVISSSGPFKAIYFVPKVLRVDDPWRNPREELSKRYANASKPGLKDFSGNCLYYVELVQTRYWNASHQNATHEQADLDHAVEDHARLQQLAKQLIGVQFGWNLDSRTTLFGKPIIDAGLSDGQMVLLQLCVAIHAQRASLDNSVFILDEPENHLHPSAVVALLRHIERVAPHAQVWLATHSVPLLAHIANIEPMSLWYVEDGTVTNAGRHPESVLKSLLGNDEEIAKLTSFTGLPAQLAAINYAAESLLDPKVLGGGAGDPQVKQVYSLLTARADGQKLRVLDFGAGKGRLLEGLAALAVEKGESLADRLDYYAHNLPGEDKPYCTGVIASVYGTADGRYFESKEEYFSKYTPDGHVKFPHLWPPQIPPGKTLGL